MTCRVDSTLIAGACVVGDRGLGVLGAVIRATTGTGTHGPGYLYNDWQAGDDGKEFRGLIVAPPAAGTFLANEDGSFSLAGAPDGVYTFAYRLYVDGADLGTSTSTITIGSTSITGTAAGVGTAVGTGLVSGTVGDSPIIGTAAGVGVVVGIGSASGTLSAAVASVEPITLADARMQCRIAPDDTGEDALLQIYIQAAREAAEHELGRVLISRGCDETLPAFPAGGIVLTTALASSVVWVKYRDSTGALQTMDPGEYTLLLTRQQATIARMTGTWPATAAAHDAVQLRYVAGYGSAAQVPAAVRQWLLLTVAALYANREALDSTGRVAALPSRYVDRLLDAERIYL
jgi:uncharacterized phiE125 gp8 family phage protein